MLFVAGVDETERKYRCEPSTHYGVCTDLRRSYEIHPRPRGPTHSLGEGRDPNTTGDDGYEGTLRGRRRGKTGKEV